MIRRLLALAFAVPLAAAALLLGGCPADPSSPADGGPPDAPPSESSCATGFLGDPSKAPVIELRALRADGTDVPLADGDDLAILFPPQGGRVSFVGVHATNLDGCGIQLTAGIRDPVSQKINGEGRTINLNPLGNGWGTTGTGASADLGSSQAIATYANVPDCPNQWASQDVFDKPFELEVVVQDSRKKTAEMKIHVTPRCAEAEPKLSACKCLCKNGYAGESCGEDAGADADAGTK